MDKHLKERLVGAVVLVAAANILIPPMLSGPHESAPAQEQLLPTGAPTEAGGVKTYTIDLSAAKPTEQSSAPQEEAVNVAQAPSNVEVAPAPPPEDVPATRTDATAAPAASVAATTPKPQSNGKLAAPAPAPAASAPSRSVAQVSESRTSEPVNNQGGWAVQVASFGVRATSERIASELKTKGFKAYVTPFESKGQTMYRVRVGPVEDRAAAEALLKRVRTLHPNAVVTQ